VRLPRALHPGAWWLWALGLATAASRTANPLLLVLIAAVVAHVVAARRTDAPWARGFKVYVYLGLAVIVIRVVFRVLLDGQYGAHILFTLPEVPLPAAAAGIRIGGPVSLEGLLAALYDGMRLAVLLLCVGAANVLANPKRLLKAMPAALHEIGVAVTVALSVAPQLIESGQRVRAARRLRGETGPRWHVFREIALPVMTDALDRSLLLAAAMDARGYGRIAAVPRRVRATTEALLLGGLVCIGIGTYGLLDSTAPRHLGMPMLLGGVAAGWAGMAMSGRRVSRSAYRPDPWEWEEWCVAGIGGFVASVVIAVSIVDPTVLYPSLVPLQWPQLPIVPSVAILVGALPAWIAPPSRLPAARPPAMARPVERVA
jgi:energy-coupling factor transport system permease protein